MERENMLKKFLKDEKGSVLPLLAVSGVVVFAAWFAKAQERLARKKDIERQENNELREASVIDADIVSEENEGVVNET